MLAASAISPEVIAARGYRSVKSRQELRRLGFTEAQSRVCPPAALILPTWRPDGEPGLIQMRPDEPRRFADGRIAKYEPPSKERLCLDVPPSVRTHIRNPAVPLFVTEGVKKGDALASVGACVIALLGVTCWRGTNENGGKTSLPDWADVALNDRETFIVFDSDVMRKRAVYFALRSVRDYLQSKGARVFLIYLPNGEGGAKMGVDDYFAAGHRIEDLLRLAREDLLPCPEDGKEEPSGPYLETPAGLIWNKPTKDGAPVPVALTNFCARIVAEVVEDDGTEEPTRHYEIEATRCGKPYRFQTSAAGFEAMNWAREMGAAAVVFPGIGTRDHARTAIQLLSGEPALRLVFTHTGWRQLEGGAWVYLHAGGAIGAEAVSTHLDGALRLYELPAPPTGTALKEATLATLRLLELSRDSLTFPLVAAVFRSILGHADFSLALTGRTMTFKSELTALMQQHFGAGMNRTNLPGSWSSTENALEDLAFSVKDALFAIDDFVPAAGDAQRLHAKADRVLRAQGNGTGRGRMRRDGGRRPDKPPRGLILSTGEEAPRGASLQARLLILETKPGDIDPVRLSACQADAAAGLYAGCMAGFVAWLAPNFSVWRDALNAQREALRERLRRPEMHARAPGMVADLVIGFKAFVLYAAQVGAISEAQRLTLEDRGAEALIEAASAQAGYYRESDPALRFLEVTRSAIAGGLAHVADLEGAQPADPSLWGWRRVHGLDGPYEPQGPRIGYTEGEVLYLLPDVAYSVAQTLSERSGDPLCVGPTSLWKRLNEARLLVSVDADRQTLKARKTVGGTRQSVLHLRL
jgi:hypothetical protein